jgi:hypothetical protein
MVRLSISVLLAFLLPPQASSPKLESYDVPEAYEVYSAILPTESSWKYGRTKWLVIRATTTTNEMCLSPDESSRKVIGTAIADYLEQNKVSRMLQRKFNLGTIPYTLLTPAEERAAVQGYPGGWQGFNQMYADSGGLLQLSAVGFNADKTIAVVYLAQQSSSFHVLQKKIGKWEPVEWKGSSCVWVS